MRQDGLLNIGFGNVVNKDKIIAIISPDAAPIKRMIQCAKDEGRAVDATCGRRTKAAIVTENQYVILSALQPETLTSRFQLRENIKQKDDENE